MNTIKSLAMLAVVAGAFAFTAPAEAGRCCAPPPMVKATICVVDPCTCCKTEVCVCIPCCCKDEEPCLACCERGFLGRKILTYKYPCGHCVTVVIKRNGVVKVR